MYATRHCRRRTLTDVFLRHGNREFSAPAYNKFDAPVYRTEGPISALLTALKQCSKNRDLEAGKGLHIDALEAGFGTNKYVATALISMYSKCGSMREARAVFERMTNRNAVLWNAIILGYVENGESSVAMELLAKIDFEMDSVTYVAAFKACAGLCATDREFSLRKGMLVHRQARERGFDTDIFVANTLVDMYRKCRCMLYAREVFDKMVYWDVVSFTSLILGYVENGEGLLAMDVYVRMECQPNSITFVASLKACASLAVGKQLNRRICLEKGKAIHVQAKEHGVDRLEIVANTLVDMYSKCGSMELAREVFDKMDQPTVVSWNNLVLGYLEDGQSLVAMDLLARMDCEPDIVTFVAALKTCTALANERHLSRQLCLDTGTGIHREAKEQGVETDLFVANALVDMYSTCGSMNRARAVFDNMVCRDVVSWSSLMLGYVENGTSSVALELFTNMDCKPNSFAFVAALKACSALAAENKQTCIEKGKEIHSQAKEHGVNQVIYVANSLLDMYSKCGSMRDGREVFDNMTHKNVISWNILILGYVECGEGFVAMDLFTKMDCEMDSLTYVAGLKACGSTGALAFGERIHSQLCKLGLEEDQVVATALQDFYGKCGKMTAAEHVFNMIRYRDIVSWNALIAGYSKVGNTSRVFDLVRDMQEAALQVDGVTMVLLLTSCNHAGMVEEGVKWFESMRAYGVTPSMEHYHCVIDMLGRANRLEDAISIIDSMPYEVDSVAWTSLLGACRHSNHMEVSKAEFYALCNKIRDAASNKTFR